jgi:hypothetical protein
VGSSSHPTSGFKSDVNKPLAVYIYDRDRPSVRARTLAAGVVSSRGMNGYGYG